MQINPDINLNAFTIRSYDTGEIIIYEPVSSKPIDSSLKEMNPRVNTTLITLNNSFIISPSKLVKTWGNETAQLLNKEHFQALLDLKPELVILGTGKKIFFPAPENYLFLQQQGIGVEIMDTAAACRTYNFLIADGRKVAAAMLMI